MQPRQLFLVALSSAALVLFLALWALTPQTGAAHPARAGDAVNFTFTVKVTAGTPPGDVLFWVCPDAKTDGTGCDEMTAQPGGTFTYQLATTTGTTFQHITIEWSDGQQPGASGPIPTPPAHITCDYVSFAVTASGPDSITCDADFTTPTVTPTPSPTPGQTPVSTPGSSGGDNSTLITGLQVVIGVGLVLFILLIIILIWQRISAPRKP